MGHTLLKRTDMQFKGKSFLHTVHLVFLLFACLMIFNVWVAYSRRSGNTGLDMAKIKELRKDAVIAEQPR